MRFTINGVARRKAKANGKINKNQNRGRSNTTEDNLSKIQKQESDDLSSTLDEEYLKEPAKKEKQENLKTKDSSDNNSEERADKKSSLFISRCEDDEESKMLGVSAKQDYDIVSDFESKASLTSRGGYHDAIKQLYLGEPKWSKSSSWVKPVPHRVYKVKTIWSEESKFDTDVRRRYSHFVWLRKMLIKEFES